LRGEAHRLASTYHWNETDIHRLSHRRRREYLALIETDEDAELLANLRG
jgi:hypothetical protein